jgi:hypothetical protein
MATALREPPARDELVEELEALWAATPAAEPTQVSRRSPTLAIVGRSLTRIVVFGWPVVLVPVFGFAPEPHPGVVYPAWVIAASVALLLGPPVAGLVGLGRPLVGLGMSAVLGGMGIAVGIFCRASAHHLGAWWMVETAAFATLAAVSIAGLAVRRRT